MRKNIPDWKGKAGRSTHLAEWDAVAVRAPTSRTDPSGLHRAETFWNSRRHGLVALVSSSFPSRLSLGGSLGPPVRRATRDDIPGECHPRERLSGYWEEERETSKLGGSINMRVLSLTSPTGFATRTGLSVWLDGLSGLSGSSGEVFGPANQTNETGKIDQTDLPPCPTNQTNQIDEIDQMNQPSLDARSWRRPDHPFGRRRERAWNDHLLSGWAPRSVPPAKKIIAAMGKRVTSKLGGSIGS